MSENVNPVMALNPYNKKLMNVEPLFRFLREHDSGVLLIDDLIKHLIININTDRADYLLNYFNSPQSMFLYLYDLRDFFKEISECQISMPKKKGGAQ